MQDTELIISTELNPVEIFQENGFKKIFEEIKSIVTGHEIDLETAKGRKEIASLAYKVSRSKTAIESLGKKLAENKKEKLYLKLKEIDAINAEREKASAKFDELRDEIRLPLTEWENAEKERIANIKNKLSLINDLKFAPLNSSQDCEAAISEASNVKLDETFAEFHDDAKKALFDVLNFLNKSKQIFIEKEKANALAKKLEQEKEEILKKQAQEKIERDAKEKAENDSREAIRKAHQEKVDAKKEYEHKLKLAEQQRLETERVAQQDRLRAARREKELKEKAEIEKEQAIKKELAAIEEQKRIQHFAEQKRKEDQEHTSNIKNSIYHDLVRLGCEKEVAILIVSASVKNEIQFLEVRF